jgi:protoporphyrinogen/coproporphyrinogen III oxidase
MRATSAVVIGAGLAGLTAAYRLSRAGWDVTVLEAADYVGGRVATVNKQLYTLDTGATQISTGYKEYLALCGELMLTDQIVDSSPYIGVIKHRRIYLIDGSKALSGALSPLLSLRGKWMLLRTIKDYLTLNPRVEVLDVSRSHRYDTQSASEYCMRRLNVEVYDALVDPLLRAYVMNRGENVSCLEWFSGLRNLGAQKMISINGGNRRLPSALATHFPVLLKTPVQSLVKTDDGVLVRYRDADGNGGTLQADACVLATRLPEAVAIYPAYREITGTLADNLRYNRGLVVHLGYSRRPSCPAIGLLLPAREQAQIGLIWLEHNKNPDRVPSGHSLFSVYFDEAVNDRYFTRDDDELVSLTSGFVQELFPQLHGTLDLTHVTRWPLAIPNPAPGIYKQVHTMKNRIDPKDRIQYAGDYFTCIGQNSAIHYGRLAAENLIRQHV